MNGETGGLGSENGFEHGRGYDRETDVDAGLRADTAMDRLQEPPAEPEAADEPDGRLRMLLLIDRLITIIGIAFCVIVVLVVLADLLGPLGFLNPANWG